MAQLITTAWRTAPPAGAPGLICWRSGTLPYGPSQLPLPLPTNTDRVAWVIINAMGAVDPRTLGAALACNTP
jgi:hypothetical protein